MKQIKLITSIFLSIILFNSNIIAQEKDSTKSEKEIKVFQLTFIPPLGTSGTSAHKYSNKFSFNMLGGYNDGVEYFELGGYVNINNGDVFGGQLAGFTNINLGSTQGIQLAGFYNQVSDNMDGLQIAGFMNLNANKTTGLSVSGFTNVVRGDVNGWLITGFSNVVSNNTIGAQFAGFANVTKGDINGLQLAGFINVAKKVNGVQLAFINIADSVDGVPFGFISVVKKGYHKFEVSANESLYGNVTAKTGIKHLYNIFTAGLKPTGDILIGESTGPAWFNTSGSGDIKAFDFETKYCSVNTAGSGTAKVFATKTLDVKIAGNGDVYYKGYPFLDRNHPNI